MARPSHAAPGTESHAPGAGAQAPRDLAGFSTQREPPAAPKGSRNAILARLSFFAAPAASPGGGTGVRAYPVSADGGGWDPAGGAAGGGFRDPRPAVAVGLENRISRPRLRGHPYRWAPVRSVALRSTPSRYAPRKSASAKATLRRSAPRRSAPAQSGRQDVSAVTKWAVSAKATVAASACLMVPDGTTTAAGWPTGRESSPLARGAAFTARDHSFVAGVVGALGVPTFSVQAAT